ncbi:TonB-dependent hemoglobin/transferrin/lactoferrin family receptor [Undibacterium sp. RuTC16W]|uniref:TonB-dependent hemoglobin/transferrin/lactoferrin family receptor n=1 Tax=Undibacterium sp. RuTC16W TaxID=3413048 RepID=UPI003BF36F9E
MISQQLRPSAARVSTPFSPVTTSTFLTSIRTNTAGQPRLLHIAVKAALMTACSTPVLSLTAHAQMQEQAQKISQAPATSDASAKSTAEIPTTLPEIQVKANKDKPGAGSKTIVTSDDLARRNASNMVDIVRYAPLISVPSAASGSGNVWDGAGNTGYNIRGIEGNRVSLDVDGIAIPDAAPKPDGTTLNSFGTGREYFDPETFREVRIGAGTSDSGSASADLGGGVTFITKSPTDYLSDGHDSYLEYKLGDTSANRSYANTLTGAQRMGDLQALAVIVHRKGHENESKGDAPVNPDDWTSDAVLAKFLWTLSASQKLDLTIDAYDRNDQRAYNNKQGASYPDGAQQDSTTKRTRVSLAHYLSSTNGFFAPFFDSLTTQIYVQDAKVEDLTNARYITGGKPYIRNISTGYYNNSIGIVTNASKQLGDVYTLTYGISADQTKTRRPWLEDRTVIATGAHQITMKNRMVDMDTNKLSAYLRDDISFDLMGHKATLTPGLRAEVRQLKPKNLANYLIAVPTASKEIQQESESYFTPSVSLAVELTQGMEGYVQYNRGTRLPSAAERTGTYDSFSYTGTGNGYAVLGNPDLQKETSNAFELGLKGSPTKGVSLRSALFYTQYKNFIEYAVQPADPVNYPTISFGLYRPENLGKVRTWGAEVTSHAELGAWSPVMQGYYLDLAIGASRGTAENTFTGQKGELTSIAPYKASTGLGYDDASQLFGVVLNLSYARSKQASNDVITGITSARFAVPAYAVIDVSGYWHIRKNIKLNVGICNLGDRKYWDYASSRSLAAGSTATALADIERQALAGRNIAASLSINY